MAQKPRPPSPEPWQLRRARPELLPAAHRLRATSGAEVSLRELGTVALAYACLDLLAEQKPERLESCRPLARATRDSAAVSVPS
jgi:hypothetical protein